MDIGRTEPVKKKSSRPKGLWRLQQAGIVLGSGTLLAAAIGTYLVVTHVNSVARMPNLASAAMPTDHSGAIIARAADGKGCRRMKFNNATGTISDDGPASCEEETPNTAEAPLRASNGAAVNRLNQISSGFTRR